MTRAELLARASEYVKTGLYSDCDKVEGYTCAYLAGFLAGRDASADIIEFRIRSFNSENAQVWYLRNLIKALGEE